MNKIAWLLFLLVFVSQNGWSQSYNMSNGTISTCSGNFYDSGGTGNYGNNQNFTYTICPSTSGSKISVSFSSLSLENNFDFLYIYDGNSTAAPLIGTYTNTNNPGTINASANNTSGCLTFRFTSDGSVVSTGWVGIISCITPCQTITANFLSSNPAPQADGIIRVCPGTPVTFTGSGTFSNSGNGSNYTWNFGNGQVASGSTATYTFNNSGAFTANLVITDPNGCISFNSLNRVIQVSTTPSISSTASPTTICPGQTANLTANVTMTPFIQNCTPPVSGTTFLPDGSGASYNTAINVNCFNNSQIIQSPSDIQNICLNMEHSFIGDLQIRIICPNGQSQILKAYPGGGGTYLGCPLDDPAIGPGTGRNYCFTPTATTLLINGGTSNCGNPSGLSINAGNYMPQQPFSNLIGCPLNGSWTIQVTDNLAIDNGYIFNWDINFNASLAPAAGSFTPTIVSQSWQSNPTLTSTGLTTATVSPTTPGTNCYTYSIIDNFGCTFNQIQCVTVSNGTNPTFTQLGPYCQGSVPNNLPTTSLNGVNGNWTPSIISTTSPGTATYTFTPNSGQCSTPYQMTVTVSPAPTVSINPITICSGETNTLTATPSTAGGTYTWSTGATTAAITVNPTTTTTYSVSYTLGACTPASATATVTVSPAPTVSINPITICSGETNTLTATPSTAGGTYTWSTGATTAAITVNPTTTTTYSVSYTLGACTPASATATVTVSPAPTVSINPITICSGSSGIITATPSTAGGTYTWSTGATTAAITVYPTSTTTYSVSYTLGACTPASATATVTVSPIPILTVNNSTICNGETTILTATANPTGGTILWSNAQNSNSITVSPSINTSYNVLYTLNGCNATAVSVVTVNPIPQVSLANETICEGENINLTAIPNIQGGTYSWSQNNLTTATISVSPNVTTNYSVIYTLNNCSSQPVSASVFVNPNPSLTVNSGTICAGQNYTINAVPSIPGGTFNWISTGETTSSIIVSPNVTTSYIVNYTTLDGCTSSNAISNITIIDNQNVSFAANIIEGCIPLTVTLYNTTQSVNNQSNCVWTINSNQQLIGCDSVTYTFTQSGCYDISLSTNSNGCISTNLQTSFICVSDLPVASFITNPQTFTETNQNIEFINTSVGALTYEWSFGDGNVSTVENPNHYFEGTQGGYTTTLTVTSADGCSDTYNFPINYFEPIVYYIPNTFTPDADEHNQTFLPIFPSNIDIYNYSFQIYNRWGEIVFESKNHLVGWDGTYGQNGRKVQQGTYIYKISFGSRYGAGTNSITGIVNLLK